MAGEDAIAHFTAQAKEGHNAELKAYAARLLPTLQEHLQLARDLAAKHQWPFAAFGRLEQALHPA